MKKQPRGGRAADHRNPDHRSHANATSAARRHAHSARAHAAKSRERVAPGGQQHGPLRGWKVIADFLALPVGTAQRWGKSGMPVRREGRFAVADADELRSWLGRESDMPAPAHIATNAADLAAGLRQSISAIRRQKRAT